MHLISRIRLGRKGNFKQRKVLLTAAGVIILTMLIGLASSGSASQPLLGVNSVPAAPTLIFPADGDYVPGTSITFKWEAVDHAKDYRLRIIRQSNGTVLYNQFVGKTSSYTVAYFSDDGETYCWQVQALTAEGWNDWSDSNCFNNQSKTPDPTKQWIKDLAADADALALAYNSADALTGAFPGFGVWHYSFNWSQVTGNDAVALAYDGDDNLAGAFPGFGVHVYDGTSWSQLADNDATDLAYNTDGELTANFPGWGIYHYDGAGWSKLEGTEANAFAYNAAGNLVASFPAAGVYEHVSGSWVQLSDLAASALTSGTNLAGTFPGFGIWVYDDKWEQLATADATSLAYNSNDDLAGAFGLFGIWYYVEWELYLYKYQKTR